MKKSFWIGLITCAVMATSFADMIYDTEHFQVTSTTDGNGLFQYSITSDEEYSFAFSSLTIYMDATLVESVESPGDWFPSIDPHNPYYVGWSLDGVPPYLSSTPLTFSIQCSDSAWMIATNGSSAGFEIENGLQKVSLNNFSYIQPIPEPGSVALLLIGGLGIWLTRRSRWLREE